MTHDRIIQKETKSTKNEGSVHGMTDKCIRAICNERGMSSWLREDAECAAAPYGEKCPHSDDYSRGYECPGDDVLWTKWLLNRMKKDEVSEYEKLG